MTLKPKGHTSVMAQRREPPDALDFFPTPPWATRALCENVVLGQIAGETCWEPAAGEGHMAEVLRPYFAKVHASDVHDYGVGYSLGSFVGGEGPDIARCPFRPDWIITNPPFNQAQAFAERALAVAKRGVALLVRTAWLETSARYEELFSQRKPTTVALFVERVPMVKGRWDPEGSTATSYAWVIWRRDILSVATTLCWIPPGRREALSRPGDRARFAAHSIEPAGDLFAEAGHE